MKTVGSVTLNSCIEVYCWSGYNSRHLYCWKHACINDGSIVVNVYEIR